MKKATAWRAATCALVMTLVAGVVPPAHATTAMDLVSVKDNEDQYSLWSLDPSVSENGRFVTYSTARVNDGSENDIWLRDLVNGTTTLVSHAYTGNNDPANGTSDMARISGNGDYVVFESTATDVVSGDSNGSQDIFRWERSSNTSELVSQSENEVWGDSWSVVPSISDDGQYVAFQSSSNNLIDNVTGDWGYDVFVKNMSSDAVFQANLTDGETEPDCGEVPCGAFDPAISGNGGFVAFVSGGAYEASDENGTGDVYVRDLDGGTTTQVSDQAAESYTSAVQPAISDDGSVIGFLAAATNMDPLQVYFNDMTDPGIVQADAPVGSGSAEYGTPGPVSVSPNGALIGFTSWDDLDGSDANEVSDGYVYDRNALQPLSRVTLSPSDAEGDSDSFAPVFTSASDGRVFFSSYATNFDNGDSNDVADVFWREL